MKFAATLLLLSLITAVLAAPASTPQKPTLPSDTAISSYTTINSDTTGDLGGPTTPTPSPAALGAAAASRSGALSIVIKGTITGKWHGGRGGRQDGGRYG